MLISEVVKNTQMYQCW